MKYTREELDWLEAEWAFHLHGRSAFLSREDFLQLMAWAEAGISSEAVVGAMDAFFERRAKRAKPRSFVAMTHLERDVQQAMKLREALRRAAPESPESLVEGWERVAEPLRSDRRARSAFEGWRRLQAGAPAPDSPGYLDHFDATRGALRGLLDFCEGALGSRLDALRSELEGRLREAGIAPGGIVWQRAWDHHWARTLLEAWEIRP